jgi:hypothetical protein
MSFLLLLLANVFKIWYRNTCRQHVLTWISVKFCTPELINELQGMIIEKLVVTQQVNKFPIFCGT